MRRFRKNKLLVLVVAVTVLSIVYVVVQKAIDNYNFGTNQDIVSAGSEDDEEIDVADGSGKKVESEKGGQISEEEVDVVLEEAEERRN